MNVIFVMNDTFRRDHLGCYGNGWIHTPNLDRLAGMSARFDRYYVASYPTVPARYDLATGRYGFPTRGWQPLAPQDTTLAQMLSRSDVHTQMIWDTPMLGTNDYNYTRGFTGLEFVRGQKGDIWITDPTLPLRLPAQPHKIKNINSLKTYLRNHHNRRLEREYCVGRTISTAIEWLETNRTHRSFFLWIDMWDPHEPFDCPPYDYERYGESSYSGDRMVYPHYGRPTYMNEDEQRDARALYAGNVTLVDRWLGHLLDALESLRLLETTILIWGTDHGHLFGDHDLQGKPGAELGRLYETTARIPLLVYHPEGHGAGSIVEALVQPVDVAPSVLEAMELPVPSHVEGQSFWPYIADGGESRQYVFSNRYPPAAGQTGYTPVEGAVFDGWVGSDRVVEPATVTSRDWALILAPEGLPSELYNLASDPGQSHNVIDDHPDVAGRMKKAWTEFLREHDATPERIRPFREGNPGSSLDPSGSVYAFRDDNGQLIAFSTEGEARTAAHHDQVPGPSSPGPSREVAQISFGDLLNDNPRNLVFLYGQYYWAADLA
jgi:arylsulfatase A-like enzyme